MAMNQITDHIWLGSIMSLSAVKTMAEKKITHIISVLPEPVELKNADQVEHLVVSLDDVDDENIMAHFEETNKFIQSATDKGESVLVHCQAGISRSVTVVCAYIMKDQQLTPHDALKFVQSKRKVANPNAGFLEQLQVYYDCGYSVSDSCPAYRHFLLKLEAEKVSVLGQVPEDLKYASAGGSGEPTVTETPLSQLKCKRCRTSLAISSSFLVHEPKDPNPANANYAPRNGLSASSSLPPSCMHYYLEPVLWMKPELEQGHIEGKLLCPKCRCRLGAYHWQGGKCSCGLWVTPAIEIQRSKVDEQHIVRRPPTQGVL